MSIRSVSRLKPHLFPHPDSYEVILIADGFAPDKILPAAFDELLRVLRPGGYIMWTMADGLAQECPDQFAYFDHRIVDLAEQVYHSDNWLIAR